MFIQIIFLDDMFFDTLEKYKAFFHHKYTDVCLVDFSIKMFFDTLNKHMASLQNALTDVFLNLLCLHRILGTTHTYEVSLLE